MNDAYIIYKCRICSKHFVLMTNEISHSEDESKYITCPYHGKHRSIVVVGRHENIKECMDHDSYKKVKGRIRRR